MRTKSATILCIGEDVMRKTLIALTSPDTAVPDTTREATITMAAGAVLLDSFSLDFGNVVSPLVSPAKVSGLLGYHITDRKPVLTISPEIQLAANGDENTFPYASNWVAGTTGAFSLATSHYTIAAPKAQVNSIAYADRNGSLVREVTMDLLENAGNDHAMKLFIYQSGCHVNGDIAQIISLEQDPTTGAHCVSKANCFSICRNGPIP